METEFRCSGLFFKEIMIVLEKETTSSMSEKTFLLGQTSKGLLSCLHHKSIRIFTIAFERCTNMEKGYSFRRKEAHIWLLGSSRFVSVESIIKGRWPLGTCTATCSKTIILMMLKMYTQSLSVPKVYCTHIKLKWRRMVSYI